MRKAPKLILKYGKKIRSLGKGTYGEVNLHSRDGKMYAVKTSYVPKDECTYPQDFLTEIICFSRCNHKNVVKMVDFFCDFSQKRKDYFYIVMELGIENLADYETETEEEKRKIALQILCGLQHLANRGIVTGDIKFENVIVFDDRVSISDFGLSQFLPEIKSDNWLIKKVYTLYYRPLEALLDRKCSTKSDIWAFGIMLCEMMTGKIPFHISLINPKETDLDSGDIDEIEEDMKIEKILSCATSDELEYFSKFPQWKEKYNSLEKETENYSDDPLLNDLLAKILKLIPEERYTIQECFNHDYFSDYRSEYELETSKTVREILESYEVKTSKNEDFSNYILDLLNTKNLRSIITKCKLEPRVISMAINLANRFPEEKQKDLIFIICINLILLTSNCKAPFFDVPKVLKRKYSNKNIMVKTLEMIKKLKGDIINTTYADYLDLVSEKYDSDTIRKTNEIALSFYIHGYNFIYTSEEICNLSIQLAQEYYEEPVEKLCNKILSRADKKNIYKTLFCALKYED